MSVNRSMRGSPSEARRNKDSTLQLRLPTPLIYCLPLLHDDGSLRFAPWRNGDPLVTNRYGIPEPDLHPASALHADDMAMIVLPLVGFDAQCHLCLLYTPRCV